MGVTIHSSVPEHALRRLLARPAGWAVWQLPPALRWYVTGVITLAAAAAGSAAILTPWRARDALLFGMLVSFGGLAVEMTRAAKPLPGLDKDVHGIWLLPVGLLLPPVYCLLAPVVTFGLLQLRTRRTIAHRRVFSAASSGLALCAASLASGVLRSRLPWPGTGARALLWLLAAASCALLWSAANQSLVMTAVKLSDPTASFRERLLTREPLLTDACEICAGLLLAAAIAAVGAALLIPALPLVIMLQRSLRYAQLQSAARLDAKTGLMNAGAWRAEATVQLARAQRTGSPVALAMCDLDHFKAINDQHGHLAGDTVLAAAAATLRAGLRPYDLLGRFGGEEFTILLSGSSAAEAFAVADRLRASLAAQPISAGQSCEPLRITVSIGIAATLDPASRDLTDLLASADAALYAAKAEGRNTVRIADDGTGLACLPSELS
jgi:diguanylate cyclase (GGDEF)-like protein